MAEKTAKTKTIVFVATDVFIHNTAMKKIKLIYDYLFYRPFYKTNMVKIYVFT